LVGLSECRRDARQRSPSATCAAIVAARCVAAGKRRDPFAARAAIVARRGRASRENVFVLCFGFVSFFTFLFRARLARERFCFRFVSVSFRFSLLYSFWARLAGDNAAAQRCVCVWREVRRLLARTSCGGRTCGVVAREGYGREVARRVAVARVVWSRASGMEGKGGTTLPLRARASPRPHAPRGSAARR
jgi:hypothetical protein